MSDLFPMSGILGLSFDSPFLSPLLFFCLVLLLFLSFSLGFFGLCFSANGPFSLLFSLKLSFLKIIKQQAFLYGSY